MNVVIYGKPNCNFCSLAKQLCREKLDEQSSFTYIDIIDEGLSRDDLEAIVGQEVRTVPQIFIDEEYVGGFRELSERLTVYA